MEYTEKKTHIKYIILWITMMIPTIFVAIKFVYPVGIEIGATIAKSLF